jgi:hypothetical protein
MTSGYVFVKGRFPGPLSRLFSFFFRLLAQFRFPFSFFFRLSLLFFRALLSLPCLFELLQQGFVVGWAATSHCARTVTPGLAVEWTGQVTAMRKALGMPAQYTSAVKDATLGSAASRSEDVALPRRLCTVTV